MLGDARTTDVDLNGCGLECGSMATHSSELKLKDYRKMLLLNSMTIILVSFSYLYIVCFTRHNVYMDC